MIIGVFVLGAGGGVRIVPEKELPEISDGGCGVITVLYDPTTSRTQIRCNGLA
jgi:hypothetical protein